MSLLSEFHRWTTGKEEMTTGKGETKHSQVPWPAGWQPAVHRGIQALAFVPTHLLTDGCAQHPLPHQTGF